MSAPNNSLAPMWQPTKIVEYFPCNLRRKNTNVRCDLPMNHWGPYHSGQNHNGFHHWYDDRPQQLALPIMQPIMVRWMTASDERFYTKYF